MPLDWLVLGFIVSPRPAILGTAPRPRRLALGAAGGRTGL